MTAPAFNVLGRDNCPAGDSILIWSPKMRLGTTSLSLPPGWGEQIPLWNLDYPFYNNAIREIIVPSNAVANSYDITWVDGLSVAQTLTVSVVAPVVLTDTIVVPSLTTADLIQNALDSTTGNVEFRFEAGDYYISQDLKVGAGRTVKFTGHNVTFITVASGVSSRYQERQFNFDSPNGAIWCEGIHFIGRGYDDVIAHGFPGTNLRIKFIRCTFDKCRSVVRPIDEVGGVQGVVKFEHCDWINGAGTGEIADHTWLHFPRFIGPTYAQNHSCFLSGASLCAITNGEWQGTSRGIVQQNSVQNNVVANAVFNNTGWRTKNAGEVILIEGPPDADIDAKYNLYLDISMDGCTGPGFEYFGNGITDNLAFGLRLAGCKQLSIAIFQLGNDTQAAIENNTFQLFDANRIYLQGTRCRKNIFQDGALQKLPISSGNQDPSAGQGGTPNNLPDTANIFEVAGVPQDDVNKNIYNGVYLSEPSGVRPFAKRPIGGLNNWKIGPKRALV